MLAEVILFWLTYVFMSFPQIIIYFMKKANLEDALREKDSDDEDEQTILKKETKAELVHRIL